MGAEQTAARQPRQEFRGHTPTNRDPDIVPKLKTLRSRVPRRRQEAAFAAFAFGPRGRGSSTQRFCSFKLAAWSVCGCCLFLPEWHHSPRRGPAQLPP